MLVKWLKALWWTLQNRNKARIINLSFIQEIKEWVRFWQEFYQYGEMERAREKPLGRIFPCLGERGETHISPLYFYQDAWAFELIVKNKPSSHVDFGSHHKFVALLSKLIPLSMIDIRPLSVDMESIKFERGSILSIPRDDKELESISSLCVVEHIGLGRYGDPLDPDGTMKAIKELIRVLAPGGSLYVSVPISKQTMVLFNAHRSFNENDFLDMCAPLKMVEKRYIYGNEFTDIYNENKYGTGCYHLVKEN